LEGLVKGDIIVIEFPYSDLSAWKRRPALVIKIPKGEDILICQITSESYEKVMEVPINKEDFSDGSLKKNSYIRIDKIASIEKSLIKYKIGSLKNKKFLDILEKIIYFLKN
jgi:mRNA interferase MazF